MVGYARLRRVKIIVETIHNVPKRRWERFSGSLQLDKKLEFNQGDMGLCSGMEVRGPIKGQNKYADTAACIERETLIAMSYIKFVQREGRSCERPTQSAFEAD